jgi:hypothetical protein
MGQDSEKIQNGRNENEASKKDARDTDYGDEKLQKHQRLTLQIAGLPEALGRVPKLVPFSGTP